MADEAPVVYKYDEYDVFTDGWVKAGYDPPPPGKKYTRNGKLVSVHLRQFGQNNNAHGQGIADKALAAQAAEEAEAAKAAELAANPPVKRGRGRPKGSKTKPKWDAARVAEEMDAGDKEVVTVAMAYERISQLPWETTRKMAQNEEYPHTWRYGRQGLYIQKAKEFVTAPDRTSSIQEINLRLAGPVVQRQELLIGPNSDLAKLMAGVRPPAAAIREAPKQIEEPKVLEAEVVGAKK